ANALVRSGIRPGERVAILAKNCIEYMLFYFAASKAGVVPVPLNYRLAAPEWRAIVQDAAPRLLLARGDLVRALEPVRAEMRSVAHWIALDAAAPGWTGFEDWTRGAGETPPAREVSADDDLYQMYTSGTTGRPKGAMLTHRAVNAQLQQISAILPILRGDRYLIVAPVYHAAGALAAFWTIRQGGTLVVMEDFDPAAVVKVLSEGDISVATLVPAMIQACLVAVPDVASRKYEKLRLVVYGASPIGAETLRRAIDVFGCGFAQGYGMTETTAGATFLMPEEHLRALGDKPALLLSCGRPLPGCEVRVVDAEGRDLPRGQTGEIWLRGPQLMRGYWNMPEATAEALQGGWMHTGDAGSLDDEGFLYIQDRVKDMIVSGAENVYPREVENALFEHPCVADVAVIGVPDPRWGEVVKALVVLRPGKSATEDELIDFCRARLAGFKRPRSVEFVSDLPRNPSGKVLKKDLREKYWKGHTRRVG
ncbi:MAG TPA: long-chain-fatty-acid--CoA ligase, partial [Myxococcota bacterium]|nr:long-chain-fatty-acid--CoA ligase [Myxococcota bacterium]